ncbi:MAG: PIG-L family deacetylase [Candidatus Omnitrophica bacterium]|nr:PIG-L family deacetylase [Candidatus Omnitrophota bacterium]
MIKREKRRDILVVAAHPDDEILGCGGTLARLIKEGFNAATLILGEGITSRDTKRRKKARMDDIKRLQNEAHKANDAIGVKKLFIYQFPDNRFDKTPLLDIIKVIEKVKDKINPSIIYTHHWNDLNVDHRIVFKAVLTACRPMRGEETKEIYSFETPSATEWNYPNRFNPNVFIDISETIDRKIKALKIYKTEYRNFPHPRSDKSVRNLAKLRGSVVGLSHAEAFECVRVIR